jgi:hypothetical protein
MYSKKKGRKCRGIKIYSVSVAVFRSKQHVYYIDAGNNMADMNLDLFPELSENLQKITQVCNVYVNALYLSQLFFS